MNTNKCFILALCLLLAGALAIPATARANEWNEATKVTFSGPVAIPGAALPAGTYWFTLAGNLADRDIVHVWGPNRTHLWATFVGIPDYRPHTPSKVILDFGESAANSPETIRAWFYPGNPYGLAFVYPESKAREIAKQTHQPVLSMRDDEATDNAKMKKAPVKAETPTGQEADKTVAVATAPSES